jgi:hypothetical protein
LIALGVAARENQNTLEMSSAICHLKAILSTDQAQNPVYAMFANC